METTDLIKRFEDGLKSKSAETRRLTAQQLYHYLKIELKDNSADKMNRFLEELNQLIFELVSSNDNNERKGGILAIDCFICADICNVDSRLSRFANYLRKLIPANDNTVMEFAARTVGKLAAVSGSTNSSLYVEFELKRVLEWLHADRNETKIYAAILVLKEMAVTTPTTFYQYIQSFFELIFKPLGDPKQYIREAAAKALRAALVVTGKRETTVQHPRPQWYTHCYQEITAMLGERGTGRDERLHGALLATNELLRSANAKWEDKFNSAIKYVDIGARIRDFDYIKVLYPQVTNSFVKSILESIQTFNFNSDERPIIQSVFGHQLIEEHYDRICNDVMVLRLSKAPFLQQAMLRILPRLAAFNVQQFVSGYLNLVINYLLILIKNREKDKGAALITLGLLALAAEEHILPYMGTIMGAAQTILAKIVDASSPSSKKNVLEPSFLIFLIMLTKALKSKFRAEIRTLTSQILLTTISKYVVLLLKTIIDEIPDLKVEVTDNLLRVLSSIVLQKPLLLQSTSLSVAAAAVAASATSVSSSSLGLVRNVPITAQSAVLNSGGVIGASVSGSSDSEFDKYLITLALHTLRSFDFHDVSMLHFVQKCAESFLENADSEIRSEAIRACVFLLRKSLEGTVTRTLGRGPFWSSSSSSRLLKTTTNDVLSKLLVIGLTDRDSEIRYLVFSSLTNCFDLYLAQSRVIDSLMIAVNDEVLEIREITMCILGRISTINPAYTYPILRKRLLQILVELEHTNIGRSKENATKILDHLVVNAPQFIIPYTEPILRTLVKKLKSKKTCKTTLTLELLQITGDLASVIGDCPILIEQMPELVPVLLELLNDSASAEKRGVAIWTLGQLQSAVGNRYCLYDHYPALLDTLINFLSSEQQAVTRREIIRVLGLIGAIDPYQHKINCGHFDPQQQSIVSISVSDTENKDSIINLSLTANEMLVSMDSACLEDYFHAVSLAVLMRIIKDPTLYQHHPMVIQAITFIFKSLNVKCVPYIPQVLPQFLSVVRNADNTYKEFLFQQLATLIFIVKYHIRSYLDEIFDIIKTHWTINGPLQSTVILLIEHIALALGYEFYDYIPRIINNIMVLLYYDTSKDKAVTVKVLRALQKFGNTLDKYMHLILSPIVSLFEAKNCPTIVPRTALESVECFSFSIDLSEFSAKIIHPLVRVLDGGAAELVPVAMNTLLAIMNQLGRRFRSFVPLVQSTLEKNNIVHSGYDVLLTKILNDQFCPESMTDKFKNLKKNFEVALAQSDLTTTVKKLSISTNSLRTAWIAARRVSKDDWLEWSRRLSLELLKESPSPALRACLALAQSYAQLPRDLFNAAFVCSWFELSQEIRNDVINVLEQTLTVPDLPEITQIVLNLAEFMEHCDEGPLPLDTHFLGQCAMDCRAYAKALHFKEKEFQRNPTAEVVEALISINNKLQQKDAAEGLLQFVMKRNGDISVQVRWYEKLNNWEKALLLYRDRLEIYPDENEALLGQMRCYEALGEWEELFEICKDTWSSVNRTESVQNIGRLATASAWNLNRWKDMAKYVECLPKESFDGAYYRAIIEINKKDYKKSQLYIDVSRAMLDTELTAMSTESYERAYGAMVSAQLLTELEEIIEYKLFPKKREILSTKWDQRLKNAQKLPTDWQRIMQLRSLVFSSAEDIKKLLKYASLCRKNGNFNQSFKVMVRLLGFDPQTFPDKHFPIDLPEVSLSYSKHLWMAGKRDEALKKLNTYIEDLSAPLPFTSASATAKNAIESDVKRSLLGRCYLKLGIWTENVHGICPETIDSILKFYNSAKNYHSQSYKVWHKFGCMNFDTLQYYKGINEMILNKNSVDKLPNGAKFTSVEKLSEFASASVHAFFRAIKLSNGKSLQDTLRLLTLWFEYGEWTAVYTAVMDGIKSIEIINWLQVIPQLIARIDSSNVLIGSLIQHILIDIGRVHPQALVYPLTVATKSSSNVRRQAANKILNILRENSTNLIDQVYVVSEELVRVAILWHELWYERLEEASRLYFGDKNIRGFLEILEPLHVLLERGPETLVENTFTEMYGHNLMEAHECCLKYKDSKNIKDLNKAWDIYYHVFQRIAKHLSQISVLELHNVSPKLLEARDLELAVPGSYVPNQPVIRISRFQKSLPIITSKQRPRKMCIIGSNGKEYFFLLKGHEDLRQDERVMQLFGLVNNLLLNNSSTFRKNLTIQRYAVIPLSTNSGLIGWVPNCDTLHTLIRDYREKKKTVLNQEHRLMIRMAPNYDHLPVVQKVEVFEHALEQTTGDDLARVLWLKSPTSEVWFNRRTNYTRSLAVMSMVGYILGLGDRHPSNIMLDRLSGKILHIDFGDCFEVAINREKFPEKIPFRLTRMLISAMEVTGIEGTYRKTCELVMAVLQRNRDSLMSVLEAFVYDPLFNWRLIDYTQEISDSKMKQTENLEESEIEQITANAKPFKDVLLLETTNARTTTSAAAFSDARDVVGTGGAAAGGGGGGTGGGGGGAGDNMAPNSAPKDNIRPSIDKPKYPATSIKQRMANLKPDFVSKKVLAITHRVRDKLTGRDFLHEEELTIDRQVDLLIQQATNNENLCQCYIGWCPFW